jgi:sugar phosphate permease
MLWLFACCGASTATSQSFGAPGFIKINSAWFSETERGTFAGIFGCMINLGRGVANWLLPALLAGFVFLGMWHVPPQHWRWLFWIPAGIATIVAIVLALVVKDTPEECGYSNLFPGEADHADPNACGDLRDGLQTHRQQSGRVDHRGRLCDAPARCGRASTSGFPVFFRRCTIWT